MLSIVFACLLCACLSGISALLWDSHLGVRWSVGFGVALLLVMEGSYAAIFPTGEGPLTLNRAAALVYYTLAGGMGGKVWARWRRH